MYILLLIVFILVMYFHYSTVTNSRHLTNEYNFAHFSRINSSNKWFFPQLLFTKPLKIIVNEGEALWIPRGWWHWVKSDPDTIAFSYWCSEKQGSVFPYKILIENGDIVTKIDDVLSKLQNIEIWNSSTDKIHISKIQRKDNSCIITLPGYSGGLKTQHSNKELYDRLQEYIPDPPISEWEGYNVDSNIWIALGYHDTGLHYDDNDGVLRVVRGRKEILLYPPEQSHLLSPLCVIPNWSKQTPMYVKYNTNEILHSVTNSLPSARLLYESIDNKEVLKEITLRVSGNKYHIWGCKWQNGEMCWELYVYAYYWSEGAIEFLSDEYLKTYDENILIKKNPERLIITSINLYNRQIPLGDTKHRYYATSSMCVPFRGYGTQDETEELESVFILDYRSNFILNFKKYMDELGFKCVNPKILTKYTCEYINASNKRPGEIYIQYLGISIGDFISFLIENNYPPKLITHVMKNKARYEKIRHEVTIVYDIQTLKHIRTGFYGVV